MGIAAGLLAVVGSMTAVVSGAQQMPAPVREQAEQLLRGAHEAAAHIDGDLERARVLVRIAEVEARIGADAAATFSEALAVIRAVAPTPFDGRERMLSWIAAGSAGLGEAGKAHEVAASISDREDRADALVDVAVALMAAGHADQAMRTLEMAVAIRGPEALEGAAFALFFLGRPRDAEDLVLLLDPKDDADLHYFIAYTYATDGDVAGVERILEQCEGELPAMTVQGLRAIVLARSGQVDDAMREIRLLRQAQGRGTPNWLGRALTDVAIAEAERGSAAGTRLEAAVQEATDGGVFSQSQELARMADALATCSNRRWALSAVARVEVAANRVPGEDGVHARLCAAEARMALGDRAGATLAARRELQVARNMRGAPVPGGREGSNAMMCLSRTLITLGELEDVEGLHVATAAIRSLAGRRGVEQQARAIAKALARAGDPNAAATFANTLSSHRLRAGALQAAAEGVVERHEGADEMAGFKNRSHGGWMP